MKKSLAALVSAQFLSAFGDNALLFTVVAIVMTQGGRGSWYIPALQSAFLLAYIVLTPWVGHLADRYPKPWVLIGANLLKAIGSLSILVGLEPIIGYGIVGMGAALYSPAKYGILPELVDVNQLIRANSWVEGATIAAILLGTVGGARLADSSISMALVAVTAMYVISSLAMLILPKLKARGSTNEAPLKKLLHDLKILLNALPARLVLLSLSLFWASAATLRVILVAWAPAVLHAQSASEIAELTVFLAVGIVIGSVLVPRLIPMDRLRRTRYAAFALGLLFVLFGGVNDLWSARSVLLAIGIAGGIFVVPLNATIQQLGHGSIGSGSAVAVQNFFQNAAMLLCMGLYTFAAAQGVGPVSSVLVLGVVVLVATVWVSCLLPDPGKK